MSQERARSIAAEALQSIRCSEGGRLSELSGGADEGAFWHFTADDYAAQERGLIPGTKSFFVDKLDGRLWSSSEATAFWALSRTSG
jgi:hypothetical protein